MADILSMLSQVNGPQDEVLAQEIIRSMLGTAAAAPASPQGQAGWDPLQLSQAQAFDMAGGIGQISSTEQARQLLGGAAQGAIPVSDQSSAETARLGRLSPVEQALVNAAAADQDSRLAAILDAQSLPSAAPAQPAPTEKAEKKALGTSSEGVVESVTEDGIAKVKKPDGSYLFTNVKDASGGFTSAYVPEKPKDHTPLDKPVSANIRAQLENIRKAEDSDAAQILASSLNASLTGEFTRMENDAYEMAAAEMGIPKIQRALVAQQSLDSAQNAYNPAMGESPQTTRLRQQLASAETQAKQRSESWLSRNVGYNQLKATQADARIAVDLAVKRAAVQEDRVALKQIGAEEKRIAKEEQAAATAASIAPAQRMLAVRTNPDLRGEGKDSALVSYVTRELKTNKQFQELWQAEPQDYPQLAFAGNKLARQLLLQDESAATGISEQELEQEFKAYGEMPASDKDVRAWAERTITAASDAEKQTAVNSFVSQYNNSKMGNSAEERKKRGEVEAGLKVARVKAARQQRITEDVLSWAPAGSEVANAALKAKEISGKPSLQSTLAVLTKGKSLQEQVAIYGQVRQNMLQAAKKYDKSVYGAVDSGALLNHFNQTALNMAQLSDTMRAMLSNLPLVGTAARMSYDTMQADMYNNLLK